MGNYFSQLIVEYDYTFLGAVASSLRMGWLGLKSRKKEIKAIQLNLFPFLMNIAATQGDILSLDRNIQEGAEATLVDYDGHTPLHIAASQADLAAVHFLLSKGADFNAEDNRKENPLRVAMRAKSRDVADCLLSIGSCKAAGGCELGAELCSIAYENDIKQMEAYCAGGTQVNITDYDGRTPLHVAVCANLSEMVLFLLQNDANTEMRDRHSNRPIDDARRLGLTNIESILVLHSRTDKDKEDISKTDSSLPTVCC